MARQALKSLTALTEFITDVNVAKMDIDGQDTHKLSKTDAEAYTNSIAQARVMVRNLEAALQMVMDDSSALLSTCQQSDCDLSPSLSSLSLGVDLACQTLRGLVQAYNTQKGYANQQQAANAPRRFSAASLRLPHQRKSSAPRIEPIPPQSQSQSQPPLPPPINIDRLPQQQQQQQPQASGSRHFYTPSLASPSMIVSPETASTERDIGTFGFEEEDDMVDMELAFSRGPPRVPSDFDASALFFSNSKDGSRESDSPEPGDRVSEGFSQHSRTTSQPTTLGSMGGTSSSAVIENESNIALPLKSSSTLDVDVDDDDEGTHSACAFRWIF